jgi:hypothetical protein
MSLFLLACRFLGSWLLVAGPVYQAALSCEIRTSRSIAFASG